MNKFLRIILIFLVFCGLLVFGISRYKSGKENNKHIFVTGVKNMLIGGMSSDKKKMEDFKASLEEESFKKFWDQLDLSDSYRAQGNYGKAISASKDALNLARGKGDEFQVRMGLARLYKETKQYDLAIKEYEWCVGYSKRPDVIKKLKNEIEAIKKLQTKSIQ